MSGVLPVYERGPITFPVLASVIITGGQMVEYDATNGGGAVRPAGAGSVTCIGVALDDAVGPSVSQGSTDPLSNAITSLTQYPNYVSVALMGVFRVTYAAACNFGELVICAANGQVTPYVAGTSTYDEIVGRCIDMNVTGASVTGLTVIGFGV